MYECKFVRHANFTVEHAYFFINLSTASMQSMFGESVVTACLASGVSTHCWYPIIHTRRNHTRPKHALYVLSRSR